MTNQNQALALLTYLLIESVPKTRQVFPIQLKSGRAGRARTSEAIRVALLGVRKAGNEVASFPVILDRAARDHRLAHVDVPAISPVARRCESALVDRGRVRDCRNAIAVIIERRSACRPCSRPSMRRRLAWMHSGIAVAAIEVVCDASADLGAELVSVAVPILIRPSHRAGIAQRVRARVSWPSVKIYERLRWGRASNQETDQNAHVRESNP